METSPRLQELLDSLLIQYWPAAGADTDPDGAGCVHRDAVVRVAR